MTLSPRLAVTSTAFSNNALLVTELGKAGFQDVRLNPGGRLSPEALVRFLSDRDGAVLGLDRVDVGVLDACPELRVLSKFGVGLDNVDLAACASRGVEVCLTPGVNKTCVAEQVLGFMLVLIRNLHRSALRLRNGDWSKEGGEQLSGKCVGIVGLGNVGRELVRLLEPFSCRILANDVLDLDSYCEAHGLTSVSKEQLFRDSDIVTIHTPLTDQTRHMMNRQVFEAMKHSAFLINTARGDIVVESDLKWALQRGAISGAAIDVYHTEPPSDRGFLEIENLICTPHIGGNAKEAVQAMGVAAIGHLVDYFSRVKQQGRRVQ